MSSRFSSAHQRDSRAAIFQKYDDDNTRRGSPSSPGYGGYGYTGNRSSSVPAYGGNINSNNSQALLGVQSLGYRPATPNARGQYSDAVLNELESQNDEQVDGILGKVRILKDMTNAIGDEIRESSALAEKMNDTFDRTRLRIRGTMNRMRVMANRTGIPWKVWIGFFAAVVLLFVWVWLF